MIVRKNKEDLYNAIIEYYACEQTKLITFEEAYADFISYCRNKKTVEPKTIDEYEYDFRSLLSHSEYIKKNLSSFTESDIIKLLKSIVYRDIDDKITKRRFNAAKTLISHTFNHARLNLDVDCITVKNIMAETSFPSDCFKYTESKDEEQVFKNSEVKKIKEHLINTSDLLELSILLTAETGLRLGEICSLKKSDYLDNKLNIVRSEHKGNLGTKEKPNYQYYIGNPKKNHCRTVELSSIAKEILEHIISLSDTNSEWLFPSSNPDKEGWERSYYFDKAIRRVCRDINIPERSMHKLRKTYSANLLAMGYPEKFVQKQLGHSDIKTTQKAYNYDIFDSDDKATAIKDFEVGNAMLTHVNPQQG